MVKLFQWLKGLPFSVDSNNIRLIERCGFLFLRAWEVQSVLSGQYGSEELTPFAGSGEPYQFEAPLIWAILHYVVHVCIG